MMDDHFVSPALLEVWIDGDCALCRRTERWCSARVKRQQLRFRNIHEATAEELPRPKNEMSASVHAVDTDGLVLVGFDAWRRILTRIDGWRWLARLATLPGVRQLGPLIYSLVAKNSRQL